MDLRLIANNKSQTMGVFLAEKHIPKASFNFDAVALINADYLYQMLKKLKIEKKSELEIAIALNIRPEILIKSLIIANKENNKIGFICGIDREPTILKKEESAKNVSGLIDE